MTVALMPMQWQSINDLHAVNPLSDDDMACMADLREVLLKHGAADRFAVHLVHKHFPVAADEVLVEYSDLAQRTQTIRVEKAAETVANTIPTTWMLKDGPKPTTICVCAIREQSHMGRHEEG